MTYFLPVLYSLLQIVVLTSIGYLLSRLRSWPADFFQSLSRFVVRVLLPLYFFARISRTDLAALRRGILFPAAALVVLGLTLAVSLLAFRLVRLPREQRRVGIALACFPNAGLLPIMLIELLPLTLPAVAEHFGAEASSFYVGAYLLVQSQMLWSVGNYLVSGSGRPPRLQDLLSPPIIGVFAGLAVPLLGLQDLLASPTLPFRHVWLALSRIGDAAFPLMLICLGSIIASMPRRQARGEGYLRLAATVAGIRFLALPLLFWAAWFLLLRRLALTPDQLWVLFLETHVPPATNLSVMVRGDSREGHAIGHTLLITYLAYLVALPFFLLAFLSMPGLLPS